jgi:uncharacterized metal-binding protein YceD (DUF177 family)
MTDTDSPYVFSVDVVHLPANGRVYTLAADAPTRAAVAAHLELQALGRLIATMTVMPALEGGVAVSGRFDADVTQTCVVTLQPLPATVGGEINRRFATPPRVKPAPQQPDGKAKTKAETAKPAKEFPEEGWIDPDEDVPDPIEDGQIDLGGVLVEELALALDPYPRAPGASFTGVGTAPAEVQSAGDSPRESPFAALAGFKPAPRGPARGREGPKNRPKGRR